MIWLIVGAGGALGAMARVFCLRVLKPRLPESLPFPTLLVNVTACFAMGVLTNVSLGHTLQLALCMGFLGGFSTLSAVNAESLQYLRNHQYARCFGYLGLTYAAALAACAAGFGCAAVLG